VNQEHANRLLVLGVLTKIVARLDREVRAAVDMDPGDRKAAYANGRRIGAVTMTDPKPAYRVTDREAFVEWVKTNRPDEIIITYAVRSSYEKFLLQEGVDITTGEAIPGIDLVTPAPHVMVTTETGAETAIRAELASNGLSFAAVLEWVDPKPPAWLTAHTDPS
jgi:hypothetical protein